MNDGDASEPQIEPSSPPPIIETAPKRSGPRSFSTGTIIILTVLTLAAFFHRNWPYLTREPIACLGYPGTTALWALHESMLFHDGVEKLPRGWQLFLALMGIGAGDEPEYCEEVLRDTIKHVGSSHDDPTTADHLRANLVVLLAEHGSMTNAAKELALLSQSEEAARFRRTFDTAYHTNVSSLNLSVDYAPADELLSGWSAWRVTTRRLQATGRNVELEKHEASVAFGEWGIVWPCVGLFTLAWTVQMAGLGSLVFLAIKRPFRHPVRAPLLGPLWTAKEYWGLFVLGFLLGLAVEILFVRIPIFGQIVWLSHCLFWGMPTVVLLGCRHWLRDPLSFRLFFGIPTRLEGVGWLAVATLALFAVAWLTLVWVPTAVEAMGFKSHWAEAFDEILRTWPGYARIIHLADGIVFGPVMEEIIYRGLLFGALRSRLPLYPAAILSALVFGGTHFYGLAGFLSVSTFGFWSALAREKTGSLLPSIATHILSNLFLMGGQALMGF